MSLQTETPGGGLTGLFARIRQTRRREAPALPKATRPDADILGGAEHRDGLRQLSSHPALPEAIEGKQKAKAPIPLERAAAAQTQRRGAIKAEELSRFYIGELEAGDYAFRVLKAEFDEMCKEAKIAAVSDRQLALWFKAAGARKYRAGHDKVTMYMTPRRRRLAA